MTVQTLKLANSAVSGIDGLVSDVSGNIANIKREAGSSSKAAGLAIDSMVTRAIEKGQFVKDTFAGVVVCLISALATQTQLVLHHTHSFVSNTHAVAAHACQVPCVDHSCCQPLDAFMWPS